MRLSRTPGRSGTISVHDARDGLATGAAMSLKLRAPSLVSRRKKSSWWSTEYSMFGRRGSMSTGSASGSSLRRNRDSLDTWLELVMKM